MANDQQIREAAYHVWEWRTHQRDPNADDSLENWFAAKMVVEEGAWPLYSQNHFVMSKLSNGKDRR